MMTSPAVLYEAHLRFSWLGLFCCSNVTPLNFRTRPLFPTATPDRPSLLNATHRIECRGSAGLCWTNRLSRSHYLSVFCVSIKPCHLDTQNVRYGELGTRSPVSGIE